MTRLKAVGMGFELMMSKTQKPPIGYEYPAEAFYWHLPSEVSHNRLQKVKVMMSCSLGEKSDNDTDRI